MKTLLKLICSTTVLVGLSAQADIIGSPEGDGYCAFDPGLPGEGGEVQVLERNTRLSLTGDDCTTFEIWSGPADSAEPAEIVPRANMYDWHSCRFVNVMTQAKIDDHFVTYANDDDEVAVYGLCFVTNVDGVREQKDYERRVLKVDTD